MYYNKKIQILSRDFTHPGLPADIPKNGDFFSEMGIPAAGVPKSNVFPGILCPCPGNRKPRFPAHG
jgi:hypothetical protein